MKKYTLGIVILSLSISVFAADLPKLDGLWIGDIDKNSLCLYFTQDKMYIGSKEGDDVYYRPAYGISYFWTGDILLVPKQENFKDGLVWELSIKDSNMVIKDDAGTKIILKKSTKLPKTKK